MPHYESYHSAISSVVEWRRADRPWSWIAKQLNALGVPSKRGLEWTNQTARKCYHLLVEKRMAAKSQTATIDPDRRPPKILPEQESITALTPWSPPKEPDPPTIDRLSRPIDEIPEEIQSASAFREYLRETQTERARGLVEDLMLAPPRLAEVVDEETIAKLTPGQRAFLTALIFTFGNNSFASRAAGVSATFHRDMMIATYPAARVYQSIYADVYNASIDHLEAVVMYRAVWGEKQYRFDKRGVPLIHPETGRPYFEYVKSDILLERFMRARRPETWRPNVEVEIDLNSVGVQFTDEQLRRIAAGESPRKVLTSG